VVPMAKRPAMSPLACRISAASLTEASMLLASGSRGPVRSRYVSWETMESWSSRCLSCSSRGDLHKLLHFAHHRLGCLAAEGLHELRELMEEPATTIPFASCGRLAFVQVQPHRSCGGVNGALGGPNAEVEWVGASL
jgi:hypothetical protein